MKLSTGELCRILGIQPKALRIYEEKGFLHPGRNKENGYREYRMEDLFTFLQIKKYQSQGHSLAGIERIFKEVTFDQSQQKLSDQIHLLDERIRDLTWQRDHLQNVYQAHQESFDHVFEVLEDAYGHERDMEYLLYSDLIPALRKRTEKNPQSDMDFSRMNIVIIQHLDQPLRDGCYPCSIGMTTIDPETAEKMSRSHLTQIAEYAGTFNFPIITDQPFRITPIMLQPLYDYQKENRLDVMRELHMFYNASFEKDNKTFHLFSSRAV